MTRSTPATLALVALLGIAVAAPRLAAADSNPPVPTTMSFVARLADAGVPLTGTHDFQLDLFDMATGGTSKWTETFDGTTLPADGVLFLELGQMVPLDATVFDGTPRFLQITIDGVASTSRIVVGSAPYAVRAGTCATATTATTAGNATTLASHPVTDFQLRIATACPAGSSIQSVNADGTVGCETDQNTTYTAGPGIVLSGGNVFSADTTIMQVRVGGTCATGKYIQAIAADGSVTCGVDANTVFTAGTGLTLTGTQFAVNTSQIQARVGGTCGAGTSISAIDAAGNVTCEANVQNQNAAAQNATMFVSGTVRTSGLVRTGSEDGGADAPSTNLASYDGVVHRRMVSATNTPGAVFAKTDVLSLVRSTTSTGLNIGYPAPVGVAASVECWGVTTAGASIAAAVSLSPADSCPTPPCAQQIFATTSTIQALTCIFGSTGHTTEVTMHRAGAVWTGFVTSDLDQ